MEKKFDVPHYHTPRRERQTSLVVAVLTPGLSRLCYTLASDGGLQWLGSLSSDKSVLSQFLFRFILLCVDEHLLMLKDNCHASQRTDVLTDRQAVMMTDRQTIRRTERQTHIKFHK